MAEATSAMMAEVGALGKSLKSEITDAKNDIASLKKDMKAILAVLHGMGALVYLHARAHMHARTRTLAN